MTLYMISSLNITQFFTKVFLNINTYNFIRNIDLFFWHDVSWMSLNLQRDTIEIIPYNQSKVTNVRLIKQAI
ncbi:hypothetical protein CHRY9293_02806 [Chryseobacterium potabilaquae]|uniref:Uncharacterized protein n=1 Tax=Chryseobacterium potabilaquae TaxID=2675057 RepID=A0A6N4XDP7_9FLAO|nr:hypothetical protein CHRY9293_02806 [Chryseobacterium potabilaquae]